MNRCYLILFRYQMITTFIYYLGYSISMVQKKVLGRPKLEKTTFIRVRLSTLKQIRQHPIPDHGIPDAERLAYLTKLAQKNVKGCKK